MIAWDKLSETQRRILGVLHECERLADGVYYPGKREWRSCHILSRLGLVLMKPGASGILGLAFTPLGRALTPKLPPVEDP